mgnify:CR=1 FL=1
MNHNVTRSSLCQPESYVRPCAVQRFRSVLPDFSRERNIKEIAGGIVTAVLVATVLSFSVGSRESVPHDGTLCEHPPGYSVVTLTITFDCQLPLCRGN